LSFNIKAFKSALYSHKGTVLTGQVAYRYVNSALFTGKLIRNPLNCDYSYTRGYRFNFPNAFPALYLSFSDFVATLEAGQKPSSLSTIFDNREREPGIIYSVKVSGRFANLVEEKSLNELSFNKNHPEYLIPTHEWEEKLKSGKFAITHQIGQVIYDAGFDGLIYFSFPAWELHSRYKSEMISNICVFMSREDANCPKNDSCCLELFDRDHFTEKLTT
jgi:hypothetical protein